MNGKRPAAKQSPVKRRPLSPCQTVPQIHERLRTGAKTIVIDHRNDEPLELTDAELPDGITIRIVGVSRVIITRLTPETKRSTQIVATDAARSQIFGHTTLFAYGNAHTTHSTPHASAQPTAPQATSSTTPSAKSEKTPPPMPTTTRPCTPTTKPQCTQQTGFLSFTKARRRPRSNTE